MKNLDKHFLALLLGNWTMHPFTVGALTADGVQWSPEYTTTGDDWETVASVFNDWPVKMNCKESEWGLTCRVKSSGAAEAVQFRWQVRNKHGTWLDIVPAVTRAADASAYLEYTYSGRVVYNGYESEMPAELRLQIKSVGAGGETALAQVKGSSYVRCLFDPLTPLA